MPIARLVDADVLYALAVIGVLQLLGIDVVGTFMSLTLGLIADFLTEVASSATDSFADRITPW